MPAFRFSVVVVFASVVFFAASEGRAECADGTIDAQESCDDGNFYNGDGCSARCNVEAGWDCSPIPGGERSRCQARCGDGLVRFSEACDDGGDEAGDGCDASCEVEEGYVCDAFGNNPSSCETACGDGLVTGDEACDDGDIDNGDGCDARCTIEPDWLCDGAPSACEWQANANDVDGDRFFNDDDNCPATFNSGQLDEDADGVGDACDLDALVGGGGCAGAPRSPLASGLLAAAGILLTRRRKTR